MLALLDVRFGDSLVELLVDLRVGVSDTLGRSVVRPAKWLDVRV